MKTKHTKKTLSLIFAILMAIVIITLSAISVFAADELPTLTVTVDEDGVATWNEIPGADKYRIFLYLEGNTSPMASTNVYEPKYSMFLPLWNLGCDSGSYVIKVAALDAESNEISTYGEASYVFNLGHDHSWITEWWSGNDTHHWHECSNFGECNLKNAIKDGYAVHEYVDGVCVCGKKQGEHMHSYYYVSEDFAYHVTVDEFINGYYAKFRCPQCNKWFTLDRVEATLESLEKDEPHGDADNDGKCDLCGFFLTEIEAVNIKGIPAPQYGNTVREYYNIINSKLDDGTFTVNDVVYDRDTWNFGNVWLDDWMLCDSTKEYIDSTNVIGEGTYYLYTWLGAEEGFTVTEDLVITVEGINSADITYKLFDVNVNEGFAEICIKFEVTDPSSTPTEIDSIHIEGLPAPQYGMGVKEYDDNVVEEKIKNGSITVNGQVCVDEDFGNIWSDGARTFHKDESIFDNVPEYYYTAKFEEDTYYLGFWFMPATGYTFADDLSATVDGVNNADVSIKDAEDDWIVVWIKYEITAPTTTEIDSIHIEGIPAPQYGMGIQEYDDNVLVEKIKNGSITVNGQVCVDDAFGNIWFDGARAFNKDENGPEDYYTGAKFEEDTYYLGFWFMPATGYTFADDLSATVDGVNNADVSIKDAEDDWIVVWIKYEVTKPSHVHSPKDEWKSDADSHWHECTGCEGQQLEKTAHDDDDNDGKCDVCTYKMYDIQYIYDGFDLILEGYKIGNPTKASIDGTYIRTPEDVHYFVFDHKVFKYDALSDDWVACADTDVFEAGARYMVDVTLWAETGYELRPSEVVGDLYDVTLNGIVGIKDTLGFTGYSFYLPPLVESGEKCPEGEIVINGYVEGNDVVDLSLGLPDGYTSGAYGVGFMLEGIESDEVLDNTGIYRLICVLSLPANYDFNTFSKETLTVFGCEPDTVAFVPIPSAVMLQLIYTLPDAPKPSDVGIEKIELTLNGYEIGASTDDVWYTPNEGAEYVSEFAQFVCGADSYDEYIGNIVAGQKYYYMISIEAKSGYTLTSLRGEDVTLNGKAPVSFFYEDGIFLCLTYELDELSVHTHAYDNACDKDCNECGATRTPAAHVYENACDTTCDTCGATRSITHTYSTIWKSDASGHWHECSVCRAKKDEASHTPGAAATETTPQICTVCSLVITPALSHTHSAKTEWSSDETYHWHDCIGNDAYQLDKAEHSYDNNCDADCSVCGFARTVLDHKDEDENGKCDSCGADMPGAIPEPAPTPTPTPDPKPEKKGLSGGAIAAIVIGSVVVLASGGFAIYWLVIRRRV